MIQNKTYKWFASDADVYDKTKTAGFDQLYGLKNPKNSKSAICTDHFKTSSAKVKVLKNFAGQEALINFLEEVLALSDSQR